MQAEYSLKQKIINSLKEQKEIYGDELFTPSLSIRKTEMRKNSLSESTHNPALEAIETWEMAESLDELYDKIYECTKCVLHKGRNKFVFGVGNQNADVMLVGEGPGADEDRLGEPFVGRAGQLLNDILKAIHFTRKEVYIGNVVKCRPPGNRTPLPSEMETCLPYLTKQIELIKPKLILCLGLTAAQGLLKRKDSLSSLRGKIFELGKIKVMVTYHPAALLRNPNWKRGCWEDVQKFRKLYDEMKGK